MQKHCDVIWVTIKIFEVIPVNLKCYVQSTYLPTSEVKPLSYVTNLLF